MRTKPCRRPWWRECGPECLCQVLAFRHAGPRYLPPPPDHIHIDFGRRHTDRPLKINTGKTVTPRAYDHEMSSQNTPHTRSGYGLAVAASIVVIVCLSGAAVALAYAGWKVESIIGLLGSIGTVAGLLIAALPRLTQLEQKVDQVAHQTNGMMDERMKNAAADAAREVLGQHERNPRE